jgi:hypothetical protein
MREEHKMLKAIIIGSEIEIPWLPEIPKENPFKNPTYTKAYTDTPGVPNMQTFGPSYILKGPFSWFTKSEKEKRKLKKVKEANRSSMGYVEMMNNEDLKNELKTLYNLDEKEFYRILTLFNEKYQDTLYELDPNDLISLLHMFYAESTKKK